jgi:hypothetical protein
VARVLNMKRGYKRLLGAMDATANDSFKGLKART